MKKIFTKKSNFVVDDEKEKLRLRINELKRENENLSLALENYRQREKEIIDTVSFAKKEADEIIKNAKIKYALECERIKIYREKWTRLINANNCRTLPDAVARTYETLKNCQIELENMLYGDFGEAVDDYISERERLNDEPCLNYEAIINEHKEKTSPERISEKELNELLSQLNRDNSSR